STAGEQAIRILSDPARPDEASRRETSTSGGIADWTLDGELWKKLTNDNGGRMLLSGRSAARLLDARRETARSVNQARGQQARFALVAPLDRAGPYLTRSHLYWDAVERSLAGRPLTIIDPKATGRTHLYLADPERFNLNPLGLPATPAAPSADESSAGTPPEQDP